MIFVTGDTHGLIDSKKLNIENFTQQKNMTKNDYVIVAGDYGGIFKGKINCDKLIEEYPHLKNSITPDNKFLLESLNRDEETLDFYSEKPFTTLFVDGNHENFDELNSYTIEEWNGGLVHKIRPDIIHLMRGQIYTIEGKKFFTMGGATSIDKYLRKEHISWWKEELPTYEECDNAMKNLDKHNWEVDYVITHSAPDNILYRISPYFEHDIITNFLFSIDKDLKFKHWYFGHYHIDKQIDETHTCLYNNIIKI